jgi:hypothetical protein
MSGCRYSCKEGLQTKQKDHRSLTTPTCAQSSYITSLGYERVQQGGEDSRWSEDSSRSAAQYNEYILYMLFF